MEERFCEQVKRMGCTCVTISHRPALVAFHDLVLALDGEGGWTVHRGANAAGEDLNMPGMLHGGSRTLLSCWEMHALMFQGRCNRSGLQ